MENQLDTLWVTDKLEMSSRVLLMVKVSMELKYTAFLLAVEVKEVKMWHQLK